MRRKSDEEPKLHAEIISVGTELLGGRNIDTDAAFLARRLGELGIRVTRKTMVPDNPDELAGVVVEGFVPFFELVQLFEDDDGHDDVVFLELVDAGAVVEDDVGVEDEDFFLLSRHFRVCGGRRRGG